MLMSRAGALLLQVVSPKPPPSIIADESTTVRGPLKDNAKLLSGLLVGYEASSWTSPLGHPISPCKRRTIVSGNGHVLYPSHSFAHIACCVIMVCFQGHSAIFNSHSSWLRLSSVPSSVVLFSVLWGRLGSSRSCRQARNVSPALLVSTITPFIHAYIASRCGNSIRFLSMSATSLILRLLCRTLLQPPSNIPFETAVEALSRRVVTSEQGTPG
jgi:hypothetical protein